LIQERDFGLNLGHFAVPGNDDFDFLDLTHVRACLVNLNAHIAMVRADPDVRGERDSLEDRLPVMLVPIRFLRLWQKRLHVLTGKQRDLSSVVCLDIVAF
jgi:hypothetical protein